MIMNTKKFYKGHNYQTEIWEQWLIKYIYIVVYSQVVKGKKIWYTRYIYIYTYIYTHTHTISQKYLSTLKKFYSSS